jgi:hypothetical protein
MTAHPTLAEPIIISKFWKNRRRPIAHGWRYSVRPKGHGRITTFCLKSARETARLYSRRIIEVGQARAFHRRRASP